MAERLYLEDDTVTTFEATVERTLGDRVVLDRTHFYPTGGGQPHDTGTLRVVDNRTGGVGVSDDGGMTDTGGRRWRVVDVEKSDTVYHTVEPIADAADSVGGHEEAIGLPAPGTNVVCEIDVERRRAHARYHTAQHLLSALLLEAFGARTTGNQLYADHAHLDAAYDRFDDEELSFIERRLNELVADALPVESDTMDRETAEATLDADRTRIDLLPSSITELRIVEIAGEGPDDEPYDRTACAGTHVGNTADVGEIVITGRETKGADEERIRFVLGDHANGNGADA